MSDDIQREPVPSRRADLPTEEPDFAPLDYDEPPYPAVVKAAGVMWIVFGCMVLLNMVAMLLLTFVLAANMNGAGAGAAAGGGVCVSVVIGLFGAAFLYVGVQSVRGTATGTLGNGIGSIVFGLLNVGGTAVMALGGNIVGAAVNGVGGALLLTAGVLALAGGSQYKLWRKAQKARRDREAAERKERRRFVN